MSVIALCFNHGLFVEEALEAIRKQDYPHVELIIVDDCSTDDSVERINAWITTHRVHCVFVRHRVNRGICASLNEAVRMSRGEYLAICATDDAWLPAKLSMQVARLKQVSPEVGVVYSDAFLVDESGRTLEPRFVKAHRGNDVLPQGEILNDLLNNNFIPAPTALVRRACYSKVGLFDEQLCYEDWDMWLRIAQHYTFEALQTPTVNYRLVASSVTRRILWTQNCALHRSQAILYAKCLRIRNLSCEQRTVFKQRIVHHVENLLQIGCRVPAHALMLWWRAYPSKTNTLIAVMTAARFSPRSSERFVQALTTCLDGARAVLRRNRSSDTRR